MIQSICLKIVTNFKNFLLKVYKKIEEWNVALNINKEIEVSFKQSLELTGLPIMTFEVGGYSLNFILDSGSDSNLLDSTVLEYLDISRTGEAFEIFGIDGIKSQLDQAELSLNFDGYEFKDTFNIMDMKQSFNNIKQSCGANIHGLIGSSFLRKYRYKIDFDKLKTYINEYTKKDSK